jgi:hypothetical protein
MMKTEYILWGRKAGEQDLDERLITCTTDKEHLINAQKWANENGYTVQRVSTWNGERPDFVNVIIKAEG